MQKSGIYFISAGIDPHPFIKKEKERKKEKKEKSSPEKKRKE
jgi:hypothetical protein